MLDEWKEYNTECCIRIGDSIYPLPVDEMTIRTEFRLDGAPSFVTDISGKRISNWPTGQVYFDTQLSWGELGDEAERYESAIQALLYAVKNEIDIDFCPKTEFNEDDAILGVIPVLDNNLIRSFWSGQIRMRPGQLQLLKVDPVGDNLLPPGDGGGSGGGGNGDPGPIPIIPDPTIQFNCDQIVKIYLEEFAPAFVDGANVAMSIDPECGGVASFSKIIREPNRYEFEITDITFEIFGETALPEDAFKYTLCEPECDLENDWYQQQIDFEIAYNFISAGSYAITVFLGDDCNDLELTFNATK